MDFIDNAVSSVRSVVYKNFFGAQNPISTINGFYESIKSVPDGSSILDVGCGDGIYYTGDKIIALIKAKNLTIHSIDIDDGAVPICQKRIKLAGISDKVTAECIDLLKIEKRYDAILFMESFPVIPRPLMAELIGHAMTLGKKIFMYHNLVEKKDSFINILKPNLKYLTLVDFGQLTSVNEMHECVKSWGVGADSYSVTPLLSCLYGEMAWYLNNSLFGGNTVITDHQAQLLIANSS